MPDLKDLAYLKFNIMKIDYYTPFYSNQHYHIYNRGNNGETIFYSPQNYNYFLNLYDKYLSDCVETYAYCLLPNHFHFLIKVRDKTIISEQFRLFFLSYSKAINKQESRTGSLLQKRFKRTPIESTDSLQRVVIYIHSNPLRHNMRQNFTNYQYNSYQSLISDKPTKLKRNELFKWFNGRDNFITFHNEKNISLKSDSFIIEDK
jgi:putative transposase